MAHNYDPVPTYHATIPVPDDGDPAIANSVNSPLGDLADGLCYVAEPMAQGGTISLGGELEFTGNLVTFSGGLDVRTAEAFFHSGVVFNDDVTLGSSAADDIIVNGTLTVQNNAQIGSSGTDALDVRSAATFNGTANFISPAEFFSALTVNEDGALTVDGTATFNGNATIGSGSSDSLDVLSTTLFRGQVTIGNDSGSEGFTVNSPTNFEDTVEFNGNLQVDGDTNFNGDIICGGDLTCTNDVTLGNGSSDAINILGATTITNIVAPVGFSSDGRILMRIVTGPNNTGSIDLDSADVIHVPTLTTDRTYNVSFAGGIDGSWCWIIKESGTAGDLEINWVGGTSTFLAAQKAALLFMLHDGAIITLPRI